MVHNARKNNAFKIQKTGQEHRLLIFVRWCSITKERIMIITGIKAFFSHPCITLLQVFFPPLPLTLQCSAWSYIQCRSLCVWDPGGSVWWYLPLTALLTSQKQRSCVCWSHHSAGAKSRSITWLLHMLVAAYPHSWNGCRWGLCFLATKLPNALFNNCQWWWPILA